MLITTKVLSFGAFSEKFVLADNPESNFESEKSFSIGEFEKVMKPATPIIKQIYRANGKTKAIIMLPKKDILLESELNTLRDFFLFWTSLSCESKNGKPRLESRSANLAIAEVIEDGTHELSIADPRYNGIMVGDRGKNVKKGYTSKIQLVRNISIMYRDLFKDPSRHPETFALSIKGKELLKENLKKYNALKIRTLFIQSFVDHSGSELENQIESKQSRT